MFREILEAMDEKTFLNKFVDIADKVVGADYSKMKTREIIGKVVVELGKNKKYSSMYTYWSKNRGVDLEAKLSELFE